MMYAKQFVLALCLLLWLLGVGVFGAMPVSAQDPPSANKAEQAKTLIVKIRAKNSFGAGILFSLRAGYLFIATANHVVQGSPKELEELAVEFEFLRGATVQAEFVNAYPKLDLAVLRVDIENRRLRDAAVTLPFDLLGNAVKLQRGDQVYPIGHPEGEDWDVPATPGVIKKVVAEEISFEPSCLGGHSGGGLFDANWTLVGMMTYTLSRSCEAISFERIRATLEEDWGLVVNHEQLSLGSVRTPLPTPIVVAVPIATPGRALHPPASTPTPRPTALPTSVPQPTPRFTLRSTPRTVSEDEAQKEFGLDANWRPLKYIENDFEEQGEVVIDHATGLTWQKSGSDNPMTYAETQAYIQDLNRLKFAGSADWRLPTMPELLSLLEPEKQSNDLYIHPLFNSRQSYYWSSDKRSSSSAWLVDFDYGYVNWGGLDYGGYVRVVHS